MNKKIFCSLDLELTGFDPLDNEILEVGFVLFTIESGKIIVQEKWSKVFKPVREVRPKILALTGITPEEIENGERFSEYREFLNSKLEIATIVGHGLDADKRFLEAFGVRVPSDSIDTLDLVQFILPTYHSYNLENLAHFFEISHESAHRALDDALASALLLERMLEIFSTFPEGLQDEMISFMEEGGFVWADLFEQNRQRSKEVAFSVVPHFELGNVSEKLNLGGMMYVLDLENPADLVIANRGDIDGKSLLIIRNSKSLLRIQVLAPDAGVFYPSSELFDEDRFNAFKVKLGKDASEVLFILKILVWQGVNWQKKSLADINLTASGRQYKQLISGLEENRVSSAKFLVISHETFVHKAKKNFYKGRNLIIESPSAFEEIVTSRLGVSISWGRISHILKMIYNPETRQGEERLANDVVSLLSATDLFFGLVRLIYNKKTGLFALDESDLFRQNKIFRAAEHYAEKITLANKTLNSTELGKVVEELKTFYDGPSELIRWLEISEVRSTLVARPASVAEHVSKWFSEASSVSFIKNQGNIEAENYVLARLGLDPNKIKRPNDYTISRKFALQEIEMDRRNIIEQSLSSTSTLLVFKDYDSLKRFYDASYEELKSKTRVFAYGYSGGPNKMLKNFKSDPEGVLLVTEDFIRRYKWERVNVTKLIITQIPDADFTHPYILGLMNSFQGGSEEFKRIAQIIEYEQMINFVSADSLEKILLPKDSDPKNFRSYLSTVGELNEL